MIIVRYLAREVLQTLFAVAVVLLLITVCGRFVKYLAQAAAGDLASDVLFQIMLYRLPGFLELILPLSLFLGILLAYGRMYLDSEMTVLIACGYSQTQLATVTQFAGLIIAVVVGLMSVWMGPAGARQVDLVLQQQESMTEFDMLAPGRFQSLKSGTRVTYTEGVSGDRRELQGVFVAERKEAAGGEIRHILLRANSGTQFFDEGTGSRFLLLKDGVRYDGGPGLLDFRVTRFAEYGVKIGEPRAAIQSREREAMATNELLQSTLPSDMAELQWRLSLPIMVPILTLLAIPLSQVNPRQGRFFKLFPAIMLYLLYIGLLVAMRDAIEKRDIPAALGMWWVHGFFLALALFLLYGERLWVGARHRHRMRREEPNPLDQEVPK